MKRVLIYALTLVITLFCFVPPMHTVSAAADNVLKTTEESNDKTYQNLIVDLLYPKIREASDNFYKKYLREPPTTAPYLTTLLSVIPQKSDESLVYPDSFIVKVQISPYYGPHNSVGTDAITFWISNFGDIQLKKFEHIKSYEIQPNYKDEIIGKWPPA